jgi:hypothetical protein
MRRTRGLSVSKFGTASLFLVAGLVAGCSQINLWGEALSADQFAQTAFEKFRMREFRQLPLLKPYDETKIRSVEAIAEIIPASEPTSSKLTQVEVANDNLALVHRQYLYPDRTLEVSIGMERASGWGPWKLAALSVTPVSAAR